MKRELTYERFFSHPPERVWIALTDPRYLAQWFAEGNFRAEVGHKFVLNTGDTGPGYDGKLHCEVVGVKPLRMLQYTFKAGMMDSLTTVTWTLTPDGDGTRLHLHHTGFTGLKDYLIAGILNTGWQRFLGRLPRTLARLADG